MDIPEVQFQRFVDLLYECQGQILKELSDLAEPMLRGILYTGDASVGVHRIETVEADTILACPKGCSRLLHLLTPPPATNQRQSMTGA